MVKRRRYDPDRLFNPGGFRAFRKRYSRAEVVFSLVIAVLLLGILGWIVRRGHQVDPQLFASAPLTNRDQRKASADRGPLPSGLAAAGWREGPIAHFSAEKLYEKINGRADYFRSFFVKGLSFVSLSLSEASVDVELYDHGTVANAIGAYSGERESTAKTELSDGGLGHLSRNALFWVRGRFYIRAIGSDESPAVIAQLRHLRTVLDAKLPAGALPWAYQLLCKQLGFAIGQVSYLAKDAFSFDFAKGIYAARRLDNGEVFVAATKDPAAASALAGQFREGFLQYGVKAGSASGKAAVLIKDRYQSAFSAATAVGRLVVGVRAIPKAADAAKALNEIVEKARTISPEMIKDGAVPLLESKAKASSGSTSEEGSTGGEETY
ncbi:MAG: hypothetical protein H6707_09805 [Deltaproteobacteria bacterium]|nr:hypothetical protein [Deltaproteobacteria bacterium]